MNINQEIESTNKFLRRANRFLERLHEQLDCEICYDGIRTCTYSCDRHQVCKKCYMKISLCPFCRSGKKGEYPGLWFFNPVLRDWVPLSDDAIQNGIDSEFFCFPYDYLSHFKSAMKFAVASLLTLEQELDSPLLQVNTEGVRFGRKLLVRTIADCVNRKVNFPIFAFKNKQELQYCKDRWRIIEKQIAERVCERPEHQTKFKSELRQALGPLLGMLRLIASRVGFNIVQY